ncbi:hypothetical protein NE865_16275 [Phthorimaea operculella]|nr:hypothetical protein NE865_16275 [Phthorimaea operculella]
MALQFTEEQFHELLDRIKTVAPQNKNFTRCTLRFNGERDYNKVDEFVTSVSIYKQIEEISDEDALSGLPLLLKDTASTWWAGIRAEIKSWSAALSRLRSAFAPKLQPHDVYQQLFSDRQGETENIDSFLCRKRALLGMLPAKRHKEEEQIDFLYGLLKVDIRKKIARTDIKTFNDLIEKARHLESLETPADAPSSTSSNFTSKYKGKRCLFCLKRGHMIEECRKRLAQQSPQKPKEVPKEPPAKDTSPAKPVVSCYGYGAPGVFRSNCQSCKAKETPPKTVSFYSITERQIEGNVRIPTIEILIYGKPGYAYLDSAARTSIAGTKLHEMLLQQGQKFVERIADVQLADGSITTHKLLSTNVDVTLGGRTLPIEFTVMPMAKENRTLLGIDFLEKSGIILHLPQRAWAFADDPTKMFDFVRIKEMPQLTAAKKLSFEDTELEDDELPKFLQWANSLKCLSPMAQTPSPRPDEAGNDNPVAPWKLIKMDTPPRPTRPREPADVKSRVDPRIDYVPINPISLYSVDISLHSDEDFQTSRGTLPPRPGLRRFYWNELESWRNLSRATPPPRPGLLPGGSGTLPTRNLSGGKMFLKSDSSSSSDDASFLPRPRLKLLDLGSESSGSDAAWILHFLLLFADAEVYFRILRRALHFN